MNPLNPNNKWKLGFKPINATPDRNNPGGNLTPANRASPGSTKATSVDSLRIPQGTLVQLPRNLYSPPGSQSMNLVSGTVTVPPATLNLPILDFTAPQGAMVNFLSYAITSDGPGVTRFIPQVNDNRVLPFHGIPQSDYFIDEGTGPDLGNNSLVEAQLVLIPGERLRWLVSNTDAVPHEMSVRMVGYIISTQALEDVRFGG